MPLIVLIGNIGYLRLQVPALECLDYLLGGLVDYYDDFARLILAQQHFELREDLVVFQLSQSNHVALAL